MGRIDTSVHLVLVTLLHAAAVMAAYDVSLVGYVKLVRFCNAVSRFLLVFQISHILWLTLCKCDLVVYGHA